MADPTQSPPGETRVAGKLPPRLRSEKAGQTAPSGDQFLEASSKVVTWVVTWRVPIVIGVIGIFAAAGGTTLWNNYKAGRNEEASAEMYKIIADLPNDDSLAQMGINLDDIARSPEEQKERNDKYIAAAGNLEKVAKDYSDVTAGRLAWLERGDLLSKAGKHDEAAASYKSALDAGLDADMFRYRGLSGLANVLRTQQKYAEANQQYQRGMEELEGVWKQLSMLELGRTQEMAGDYKKATEIYERYLKEYPDAPNASDVEARLVVTRAGGPATPSVPAPAAPAPDSTGTAPASIEGAPAGVTAPGEASPAGAGAPAPEADAPAAPAAAPAPAEQVPAQPNQNGG